MDFRQFTGPSGAGRTRRRGSRQGEARSFSAAVHDTEVPGEPPPRPVESLAGRRGRRHGSHSVAGGRTETRSRPLCPDPDPNPDLMAGSGLWLGEEGLFGSGSYGAPPSPESPMTPTRRRSGAVSRPPTPTPSPSFMGPPPSRSQPLRLDTPHPRSGRRISTEHTPWFILSYTRSFTQYDVQTIFKKRIDSRMQGVYVLKSFEMRRIEDKKTYCHFTP